MRSLALIFILPPLLGGCVVQQVAQTAVDVVAIPVAVVGEGVDAVTTSQAEADRRRGRRIRQEEERLGREVRRQEREREREQRRARRGDDAG